MFQILNKKKFFIITTVPFTLKFFSGQVQVLKREFNVEIVSSPGEELDDFSQREKVNNHEINMKREISLLNDFRSLVSFIILFFKEKPHIIHGNSPKAGLLSMFAGWIVRVPVRIYYVHGLRYQGANGIKKKILIMMERFSCLFATDIFSVSEGVKKVLYDDGITRKTINIIGNGSINGINANSFSVENPDIMDIKDEYGIEENDFVFGFVGRIVEDKGINELVKSFKEINKKYLHTKLLLVGGYEGSLSPLEKEVKEEIENNKNIIYTGFQDDVRPFLKVMNIFVFPSYREGFGVSLIEAAAMNLPIITTNIIGCNEVITDGYNGVLIPPKSTEDLMIIMEELLVNQNKTRNIANVARESVIERYEQKKMWENILQTYCEMVDVIINKKDTW